MGRANGADAFSASEEDELAALRLVEARGKLRIGALSGPAKAKAEALLASDEGQRVASMWEAERLKKATANDASPSGPWATAPVPNGSLAWSATRFALASLVPQFSQCESVAEQMFLLGMVVPSETRLVVLSPPQLPLIRATNGRCLELMAQHPVGGRRLDFVLRGNGHRCVAVEVDGFAYHERTQEQAERDRARDRGMLAAGVVTVRFMAKAVFADPSGCADEAFALALGECKPEDAGKVLLEGFSR